MMIQVRYNDCDIGYYFQLSVNSIIPRFTYPESTMTGCSITEYNDTLIYQTPNPYHLNSDCKVEFKCPIGLDTVYNITRFGVDTVTNMYDKYKWFNECHHVLGFNNEKYCSELNEPPREGILLTS